MYFNLLVVLLDPGTVCWAC